MRPRARTRTPIKWDRAAIFLVVVPLGLAAGVAVACALLLGNARGMSIGLACPAYFILAAGAWVVCMRMAPKRAPLWLGLPAVALGCFHAWMFFEQARWLAAHPPQPGAPAGVIALVFIITGGAATVVAILWTIILLAVAHDRFGKPIPSRFCVNCKYDRDGLAPGAACPECGASNEPRTQ